MQDFEPIFVRGVSRSGGTLMVTILDAHPDVAMSYELYPNLLQVPDPSPEFLRSLIGRLAGGETLRQISDWIGIKVVGSFLMRLPRGGLHEKELIDILREQVAAGMGFRTSDERLRFVERCCKCKMRRLGKKRWGLKCTTRFADYRALWPNAHFINMVRDGRDVLASTLNTGSFNKTPAEIGYGWANTIRAFRLLAEDPEAHAHSVIYEKLAADAELVVQELCIKLGLQYTPEMLEFHRQDLTIYETRHLSGDRISKPIDASRIGRWRKEASPEQLASFYSTAREMMIACGYLEETHAY